jgi:PAS domain S-box-containing protein
MFGSKPFSGDPLCSERYPGIWQSVHAAANCRGSFASDISERRRLFDGGLLNSLRVLIVDDHEATRRGLRSLLSSRSDWEVCGEAEDGIEAVEKAIALRPDVVLMDISMPRMNGLDATRVIRRDLPASKVVIVSQNDPAIVRRQALGVNAAGCVSKSDLSRELISTLDKLVQKRKSEEPADSQGVLAAESDDQKEFPERTTEDRVTGLLAAIVDSSDDAIISKNLNGIITSWNEGARRMFGYTAQEAIGRHITLIIPSDRRDEEPKILERLKRGERVDHFETVRVRKDGRKLDISLTISPVKDAAGHVVGASKVARDVSDQKQIERTLRESEERFRAIVETTSECVKLVSADGTLLHMNSSGLTMVGAVCADEVTGKSFYDLVAAKDREKFRAFNERICRGEKGSLEFDIVGLKGTSRRMETHAAPLRISDGTVVQLGVTRDITERTLAEENLRRSEEKLRELAEDLETQVRVRTKELEQRNAEVLKQSEQLRDLSSRVLQAQDQERRHIARELHDSAGQIVTVLGMSLAQIIQQARENAPQIASDVDECRQLAQQLSQEIRTTSYLLYPPLLDETGLQEALRWYIQGLTDRSGLDIRLDVSADFGRLPREMELVVYRLVQECLTNIHRHSGSKTAVIRLVRDGEIFSLEVEDAGKGIPPEKLNLLQLQGAGVGLRGMRERIRPFDGQMNIMSNDGGTTISFIFRLPGAAPSPENIGQGVQGFLE